jgi:hypothetical protein
MLMLTGVGAQEPSSAARLQVRYQVRQMEGVLSAAAEHGAKIAREKLRAVIPADMLLSDSVRVRGIPLEGYGLYFDVEMPPLEGVILAIFQTLDQNRLGLQSAMREVSALVNSTNNTNVQQSWRRIEMQMQASVPSAPSTGQAAGGQTADPQRRLTGSAAALSVDTARAPAAGTTSGQAVSNPQDTYHREVQNALIDAMLDHSAALRITDSDWLTVAARGNDDRPRLGPGDDESPIVQISVRGAVLSSYLAKQISREEAIGRFVIKMF